MSTALCHLAQVQHIVTETRDKIMQYKSKMADEADLRRRLASLEESVELHEHMKRQVIRCCWAPRGLHLVLLRLFCLHPVCGYVAEPHRCINYSDTVMLCQSSAATFN